MIQDRTIDQPEVTHIGRNVDVVRLRTADRKPGSGSLEGVLSVSRRSFGIDDIVAQPPFRDHLQDHGGRHP